MFRPVIHCRSMFSNLLLHRVQAFLDIVPADVNVCCIQPVVVDRDCIFLSTNTIDNAILTAATLHNIQQISILSIFMTFTSTVTVKLVPILESWAKAATPYHQESSCGWRKGEDRPLVRVIALYSLWQGGHPADKKPIPLTPEVLFRNRQRRTGGYPGKMAVKQKWFHS